jgi:hypothetical protein
MRRESGYERRHLSAYEVWARRERRKAIAWAVVGWIIVMASALVMVVLLYAGLAFLSGCAA